MRPGRVLELKREDGPERDPDPAAGASYEHRAVPRRSEPHKGVCSNGLFMNTAAFDLYICKRI